MRRKHNEEYCIFYYIKSRIVNNNMKLSVYFCFPDWDCLRLIMRNIITDTLLFSSPHTIDCCNLLLTGRETEDWQRLKKRHLITFLGFVIIISDLIYLSKTAWPILNEPTPSCLQVRKYITLIHIGLKEGPNYS